MEKSSPKTTKEHISLIFDSLVDIIKYPKTTLDNNAYFYHTLYRSEFIVYIYIFKLLINENDYLKDKYEIYKKKYPDKKSIDFNKITNLKPKDELDLLYTVKDKMLNNSYRLSIEKHTITYKDLTYIDSNWLITFTSLLLDNSTEECDKEINICYTIPNKDIFKLKKDADIEAFLSEFTFYNIKVKHVDKTRTVKENNILIVKNAAINYLKHLKQYKHGLESKETYKIFYNLLKNECNKQGFILTEEETPLLEEPNKISIIEQYIDKQFTTYSSNKQSHIIENIIWQSSNDINLLEQINTSIDSVVDLITILHEESHKKTYKEIKDYHTIKDIQILSILLVLKFINTYYLQEELDYSLIDLTKITPKYMSIICDEEEQELKTKIKQLDKELTHNKEQLSIAKEERTKINKEDLKEKYNSELERCVSNINKYSINIGTINNQLSTLSRRYEEIKKEQRTKYKNIELYHYNNSIIKHMINSILSCSFYLKTNNNTQLLSNIIILEDYYKTENAFYAEIPFNDLIKISNNNIIKRITDNIDLPKLVEE